MKLRVWHNCQVGAVKNFYADVDSIDQAWKILNTLWNYDLFQYENKVKPDYCNMSGLEYYDEEEKDWCEWYDDDGYDIKQHFENLEEDEQRVVIPCAENATPACARHAWRCAVTEKTV